MTELAVRHELLPGAPLTLGVDAAGRLYGIVLKAGNHGDEAALATLLARAKDARMSDNRPLLAITLGDPAGIGPEVVLKALRHAEVYERCRPLVLGDRRILERAAPWVGATDLSYELVDDPAGGRYAPGP